MRHQQNHFDRPATKLEQRLAAELPDFEGVQVVFGLEEPENVTQVATAEEIIRFYADLEQMAHQPQVRSRHAA